MNTARNICLLFLASLALFAEAFAQENSEILRIGVSVQAVETGNSNDATAALKAWVSTIIKEKKLDNIPAEAKVYESAQEMGAALRENRMEAAALSVEEDLQIGLEPETVLLPARDHGVFTRYVILVHRDSSLASPEKLSPDKLHVYMGPRMSLAVPWVRSMLNGPPEVHAQSWITGQSGTNTSKAILQVFFRQIQAVLVTRDAFDVSCELNPQLGNDLRVLAESPPFVTSVIMMRPSWRGRFRQTLEEALLDLHSTPGGRQVLTIFQSSRIERHPPSILEPTREFLRKHLPAQGSASGAKP